MEWLSEREEAASNDEDALREPGDNGEEEWSGDRGGEWGEVVGCGSASIVS